jgi:hypothetical protein
MLYIGMSQAMQVCCAALPEGAFCGLSLKKFSVMDGFSAGAAANIFFGLSIIIFIFRFTAVY